ncbi:23S rRNA (adenine(2503)-C(2))-methyltransferase RlmN [Frisingicoccus sp.]|uniref:23S rRNA (adenine(2503)-C(2))-methyltransferase RlmN n=1 Tax=Frisingicoccus sp. TaxID=1918627 RepID=UPI002632386B|nr:23S rRNA (adenine(2503)-C(2))-methyltransferase RlmN [Frisingicoccus sp.]MDD6233457.1 23S rRNA (adenine(2503)-C(2))-methyltransferase RlmN [Frisingicoccus sp.]MDY4834745.1 23S rRNA (adenine(2503)-C(2))-methyltransferase RlmN [Frisingicoccus sp.]MDY4921492.1 23S rRNA (adenine(2503)-C(2))-methyltransferase RlmN [Frisingicoccus sp.]MDY5955657.1 23S rRNA (adenine(2503)-C(2))-methyltransferase RlmN [Frisingicoccus sp.]
MEKKDIRSMTPEELEAFVVNDLKDKKFRARQIYDWMHVKCVQNFDEMTNLSKDLRQKLSENATLCPVEKADCLISQIDGTRKYLFRMEDGSIIESVLMKYKHGNSVCISSQVGCRMGCRFCASTLLGLERNLNTSEMLGQIYAIQRDTGERVSNVVIMGTGEPLDNYDAVVRFIRMISDEKGLNISQRNITLSTCGIVPKIYQLADEHLQITLAISLHASDNEKRKSMMPIANKYDMDTLLEACRYYYETNGRRLTFEYSLARGVNDSPEDARALAKLLKGFMWHVNLIPINPVEERSYVQSDRKSIVNFKNSLEKYGGNVTIRREMGRDIQAACGQLRRRYMTQIGEKEV